MASMDDAIRKTELERALKLLRSGKTPAEVIEMLSRRLTAKVLHAPTKALQQSPG
jgi:glutamyl-tRNA reductase